MNALRDRLLLEGAVQVRSAWTVALAAALLIALLAGSYSTLGWTKAMSPTLESIRQQKGSAFPAWLTQESEAAPFRNDLATMQPRMSANLYLTIAGAIGPLLAAIWGARAIGLEFGMRTARVRAVNQGWTRVVASKHVVLAVVTFATAALVPLLGLAGGLFTWSTFTSELPGLSSLHLTPPPFSPVLGTVAVALGMLLYGLVGCLAALITRSTAGGIVVGVAIPYVEGFLGFPWLPRAAYGSLLTRWLAYYDGSFVVAPGVAHPTSTSIMSVGIMGVWMGVLAGGALLLSRRQEIA